MGGQLCGLNKATNVGDIGKVVLPLSASLCNQIPAMAAPIKVFGPAMSTATARVLACLLENQLQFDLVPVDMSKGQHKSPEFLAIQVCSPFSVPPSLPPCEFVAPYLPSSSLLF